MQLFIIIIYKKLKKNKKKKKKEEEESNGTFFLNLETCWYVKCFSLRGLFYFLGMCDFIFSYLCFICIVDGNTLLIVKNRMVLPSKNL
jgi:hypothetical protein